MTNQFRILHAIFLFNVFIQDWQINVPIYIHYTIYISIMASNTFWNNVFLGHYDLYTYIGIWFIIFLINTFLNIFHWRLSDDINAQERAYTIIFKSNISSSFIFWWGLHFHQSSLLSFHTSQFHGVYSMINSKEFSSTY